MPEDEYLFVCDAGITRSKTAHRVFQDIVHERGLRLSSNFFGFDSVPEGPAIGQILRGAKQVFVMDEKRVKYAIRKYGVLEENIVNLEIEDVYDTRGLAGAACRRMLEETLRTKLEPYIDEIRRTTP